MTVPQNLFFQIAQSEFFDVPSFVLNTLITLLLSVDNIVYDFAILSFEEIVS